MVSIDLLGVPLHSYSEAALLDAFDTGTVVFHNLDTIYKAQSHDRFLQICRTADFSVVDSQVVRGLVMMMGAGRIDKVSGSDFLPAFCRHHATDPSVRVFLLGAGPGVAERARLALNDAAGRELVVGAHSPSFNLLHDQTESAHVVDIINKSAATALAVGLGAPKQEIWIAEHRDQLPDVTRFMAVGATLDFQAGRVKRAPRWVSAVGMEWLFRLLLEPRRLWRRYLVEGPQLIFAMIRSGRVRPLGSRQATAPSPNREDGA